MNEILIVDNGGGITIEQVSNPIEVVINKPIMVVEPEGFVWVRNGRKEIEQYVNNVSKPDINEFSETKKVEIDNFAEIEKADIVEFCASEKKGIEDFVADTIKPELTEYVNDEIKPELAEYVSQAAVFSINAKESESLAATSATSAFTQADRAESEANRAEEFAEIVNPENFVTKESFNDRSLTIGDMIISPKATRNNCLICNGAAVSRITYAPLFDAIGTMYGSGNGVNTFNIPDMRGRFIRGSGGLAAAIGIAQNDALQNITGTFCLDGSALNNAAYVSGAFSLGSSKNGSNHQSVSGNNAPYINFDASRVVRTANETRPVNHSFNFFIQYK